MSEVAVQPTPPKASPLMRALVAMFLALGLGTGIYLWGGHANLTLHWKTAYDGLSSLGDACEVAVDAWRSGDSFESVRNRGHSFRPLAMPYRGDPNRPNVPEGSYLYTRCRLDLSGLSPRGFAWLQLGTIFGRSAVFLDGRPKIEIEESGMVEFPLLPTERGNGTLLEIVSLQNELNYPGLGSLLPIVASDQRAAFDRIVRMLRGWDVEMPATRIAFAAAMLIAFASAWLLGFRYPDVGWMVVITALLGLESFFVYDPHGMSPAWHHPALSVSRVGLSLAFAAFLWTFLRVRRPHRASLESVFLALLTAYAVLAFALPAPVAQKWSIHGGGRLYVGALAYLWAGAYGLRSFRSLPSPRKWRVFAVAVLGILAAVAYVVQAFNVARTALLLDPFLNFALASTFGVILASDLVLYHREYFRERARRLGAAEAQARDAAVARTTQMLAHDVRKPFSMLHTVVSQLGKGRLDRETLNQQLDHVEEALATVDSMLQDVMLLGTQAISATRPVSVEALVKKSLAKAGVPPSVVVACEFDGPREIDVDPAKIERVVVNIVENAVQAMQGRGRILISTTDAAGGVEIRFYNTGTFIPEADRERVFDPFFTKDKVGGTGLGLAVVRRIVTAHGGSVRIDSELGVGTSFILTFPRPNRVSVSSGSYDVVVVIDDDPFIREAWLREVQGPTVLSYDHPGAALAAFQAKVVEPGRVLCIVVDFYYPGLPEADVRADLSRLRAETGRPVFLSSDSRFPDLPAGVDRAIGKTPLSAHDLRVLASSPKAS